MATITRHLTSISPRSGSPPGRRLLALVLCAMLVVGGTFPGFAVAGEADSEGEGTTPPIEVPVGPPDFDPGGEETGLEEEGPDSEGEEAGAVVEPEVEVEPEAPVPAEVLGAAPEVSVESPPPAPAPEPATAAAPEPGPQAATEPAEPIANQSIVAPKQKTGGRTASASVDSSEAPPAEEESPPPSQAPVPGVPPTDQGRNLGGKNSYVVQPGDCLSCIAADLLPAGSDARAIEEKVAELWRINSARIGTGDPNLIYPGTVLRLR
jgi:hypothetical protein